MGQTELYREGMIEFRETVTPKNKREEELLDDFLQERATALDAKRQADELQKDTQQKYGRDLGKIPKSWIDNILGNINRFISVGDYVMKGAPETIGIAWMVTKLTLSAIQENYELYGYFGEGLTTITEIMTILPHYDKMYDMRSTSAGEADDFMNTLYSDLRTAYSAVLQFCFAVKRHVKARKRQHLLHGVKDFFGAEKISFQAKLELVVKQKNKVIEGSNGAFQKRVFEQFTGLGDLITNLRKDLRGIDDFANTAQELRDDQERMLLELGVSLVENVKDTVKESFKELARPKTPWELASDKYEKHMKSLNAQDLLKSIADSHPERTGSWIADNDIFIEWAHGEEDRLMLVVGKPGSGKTVTASAMLELVLENRSSDVIALSVSGNMTSKGELGQRSQNAISKITTAFMHQLYTSIHRLAETDGKNAELLGKAIDAFRSPKQEKSSKLSRPNKREDGPNLYDVGRVVRILPESISKVFLIIDGVDGMDRSDQDDLSKMIIGMTEAATNYDEAHMSVLVTCFRTSPFFGRVENDALYIDLANETSAEMQAMLDLEMQDLPNLSEKIRNEAKNIILGKASGRFNYLTDVVKPFIRLPYQGSFLQHLDDLPDTANDTYVQAVQSLDAGSVGLLHSALSLTLYGSMTVKVQEILDIFSDTYTGPCVAEEEDSMATGSDTERPVPSKLQIEQVERATEPFLKVWHDLEDVPYVELQDALQVQRFCATAGNHAKGAAEERAVCARCTKAVQATHALAFSEKEWHLGLALRCLKHLNNPLFQRRYGLTATLQDSESTSEEPDNLDSAATADTATREASMTAEGTIACGIDSMRCEDAEAETMVSPEEYQASPQDSGTQSVVDDIAIAADLVNADSGQTNAVDDAEVTPDSDSVVDETDIPENDSTSDIQETPQWSFQNWTRSRYEIDQWCEHLYTAETLWSDREERLANASWQNIFSELETFTTTNRPAFELWQNSFFARHNISAPPTPWTPLNIAAFIGSTAWAERLMDDQGADPREVTCGRNALQAAAILCKSQKMLELLLERGVDPNVETGKDIPAFHSWIWSEPTSEAVETFLKHGGDPSKTTEQHQRNLLHVFAFNGTDADAFVRLLQHESAGMEHDTQFINAVNTYNETPLHRLVFRSPVPMELLQAFIAHGASIDVEDEDSERPLQSACRFGDKAVVEVLLQNNNDVDDPDSRGRNAMHHAAWAGHRDCIDLLISAGANPHAPDLSDRSPLFYACLLEDGDTAKHVLQILSERKVAGVDINMPTKFGQTPLREAARNGLTDVVAALLDTLDAAEESSLAILNKVDTVRGRTALHLAARKGHTDIVDLLVKKRADVGVQDTEGKTALTLCTELWALTKSTSFEEIACLLVDVDTNAAAISPELAATAAMNDSTKVLEHLHNASVNLHAIDRFGWSPLALARHFGSTNTEEYLVLRPQSTSARDLPVCWVGGRDGTMLSEDGLVVTQTLETKYCLSTEQPLPSDLERYYFEITSRKLDSTKQEEYPILAIGFCTHGAEVLTFPGWSPRVYAPSARSWAYHGDDGGFFHNVWTGTRDGDDRRYKPGDTVGCGFDLKSRTIWFTRNGEIMQPPFGNVAGRMFPVIGLHHAVELETNFGTKPFRWNGGTAVVEAVQNASTTPFPDRALEIRTVVDADAQAGAEVKDE